MINDLSHVNKVAIYTRVSTEEQAQEGYSLDAQLKKLRAYCENYDLQIYNEYIDGGYSGRNIKRPGYSKMIADINNWDAILVIKMDRIHRNQRNFTEMMKIIYDHQKDFISMMEKWDTSTAIGRFVMDIMQRVAQLESEQTGERVTIGMNQKHITKESNHILGRLPIGFKVDKTDTENHKLKKIPNELEIVKQIFKMYEAGETTRSIANKLGINPRSKKHWHRSSIEYVLHNPIYAGFQKFDNTYILIDQEPLFTREYYNMIQDLMTSNIDRSSRNKNVKAFKLPLTGNEFTLSRDKQKNLTYRLKAQKRPIF